MIVLEEFYERAYIGHDISAGSLPHACYSLPLLAKLERKRMQCDEDQAQNSVVDIVRQITKEHGDSAPLFIDDSITRIKKEKSRIIRPGGR
jgi:hypothetical protein